MCKEFEDFLKGHDERMNRAQQVGVGIKAKHDKKRRKILGELDDTVGLNFFSIKHETFFPRCFISARRRSGNLHSSKVWVSKH